MLKKAPNTPYLALRAQPRCLVHKSDSTRVDHRVHTVLLLALQVLDIFIQIQAQAATQVQVQVPVPDMPFRLAAKVNNYFLMTWCAPTNSNSHR
jgi:hypothetical protein